MPARLWVDVEDLFEYARGNRRPSGIQRLAFEIYQTMQAQYGGTGLVQFVRHDIRRNGFRVVPWHEVAGLFRKLTESAVATSGGMERGFSADRPARQLMRKLVHRLSPPLRLAVIDVLLAQSDALRAWGRLAAVAWHSTRHHLRHLMAQLRGLRADRRSGYTDTIAPASFAECAADGDVILMLGSPWSHPDHAALVRKPRERGLRFALLVYDLIPIRRPEWYGRQLEHLFHAWFHTMLPLSDTVFAISQATAADVEAYARERNIALRGPVTPIPIGTGFTGQPQSSAASSGRTLPSPASYVLFVSTIEPRKNHALLFRVWRQLLEDLPAEQVPTLVFAGHIGWLVDDLMRQIANTDYLDGKLVVIEDPTDADLTTLYRSCLFTVFPSFYEGWGLPVSESLAFGKPCIIANRTALPEAGGRLVRSFDPDSLHDAYDVIRKAVEDRAGLVQWEAEIRHDFKPVPWSATVEAILTGLGNPHDASTPIAAPPDRTECAAGRILAVNG